MHGSGVVAKLSMTRSAYGEFRANEKFKPIVSSTDTSAEKILADAPYVLIRRWNIDWRKPQRLEAGGTAADSAFVAVVELDGSATVYLYDFN